MQMATLLMEVAKLVYVVENQLGEIQIDVVLGHMAIQLAKLSSTCSWIRQ
jgi:hypothetical protein